MCKIKKFTQILDKKRIELGENGLNAIKKFPQIKFTEQILNT